MLVQSQSVRHISRSPGRHLKTRLSLLAAVVLLGSPISLGQSQEADGDAIERLQQLAEAEAPGTIVDAPLPPGVDAESLALRSTDDANAGATLREALTELAKSIIPPAPKNFPEPSEEVQYQAERYYLEARDLYLDGRHFDSIEKLEQARRLDPGSVPILRLLARNRQEKTGSASALPIYELIISIDPDDTEALFRLGSAELERNENARAATSLSRLLGYQPGAHGYEQTDNDRDDRDATVLAVATTLLGAAMFEAGYDTAGIEAWEMVVDTTFTGVPSAIVESEWYRLRRAQGAMHRDLTDAYLRLGRIEEAWQACENAHAVPMPDPGSLLPRRVYLARRTSQPYRAMAAGLDGMQQPADASDALALVEYLRDLPESHLLAKALAELGSQNPDQPRYVQAAAILMDEKEARDTIAAFMGEHANDVHVVEALLPWVLDYFGTPASVDLVVQIAATSGASMKELAQRLIEYSGRPDDLLNASEAGRSRHRQSLARGLLHLHLLIDAARLNDASRLANQLVSEHPDSIPALLTQVELSITLDLRNEATLQLERLNRIPPQTPAHYYEAATLLGRLGRSNEAVQLIEDLEASVTDPGFDWATHRVRKAEILMRLLRPRQAVVILELAIEASPEDERAYAALIKLRGPGGLLPDHEKFGNIAMALREHLPLSRTFRRLYAQNQHLNGRYGRAIEEYLDLLRTDMTDATSLRGLLNAWAASDQHAAAERWLREQIESRPGDARLREALIEVLVRSRRPEESLAILNEQLLLRPLDFRSARTREELLTGLGRVSDARQAVRDRLDHMPESVARSLAFADLAIEEGKLDRAREHLDDAVKLAAPLIENHLDSILRRASSLDQAGAPDDANAFAIRVVGQALEEGRAVSVAAIAYYIETLLTTEEPVEPVLEALAQGRTLHQKDPEDRARITELTAGAGQFLSGTDRDDDAIRVIEAVLDGHQTFTEEVMPLLKVRLGIAAKIGSASQVISWSERIEASGLTAFFSEDTLPVNSLTDLLYRWSQDLSAAGHDEAAEAVLIEALRHDPTHPMANNNLAYAWVDRNERMVEAEAMLMIAFEAEPSDVAIIDSLGWTRYKLGKLEDEGDDPAHYGAITLLREASLDQFGRDDPVILDHLGDALWRASRTTEALAVWKKVKPAFDRTIDSVRANPSLLEYFNRVYTPVVEDAEAKIRDAEAGESPGVAPSPGLDR